MNSVDICFEVDFSYLCKIKLDETVTWECIRTVLKSSQFEACVTSAPAGGLGLTGKLSSSDFFF